MASDSESSSNDYELNDTDMTQIKEISDAVDSIQNRFFVTGAMSREIEITLSDDTKVKFPMSTEQKEGKMKAILKNSKPSPFGKGMFQYLF